MQAELVALEEDLEQRDIQDHLSNPMLLQSRSKDVRQELLALEGDLNRFDTQDTLSDVILLQSRSVDAREKRPRRMELISRIKHTMCEYGESDARGSCSATSCTLTPQQTSCSAAPEP